MTDAVYANKIDLQIAEVGRLFFIDERPLSDGAALRAEVVVALPVLRMLRDLLVEHVKDEPPVAQS